MKQFELIFVDLHYIKHQKYFHWVLKKFKKAVTHQFCKNWYFYFSQASVYVLAAHKLIPIGTDKTGFRKTV